MFQVAQGKGDLLVEIARRALGESLGLALAIVMQQPLTQKILRNNTFHVSLHAGGDYMWKL